eukprot:733346_1
MAENVESNFSAEGTKQSNSEFIYPGAHWYQLSSVLSQIHHHVMLCPSTEGMLSTFLDWLLLMLASETMAQRKKDKRIEKGAAVTMKLDYLIAAIEELFPGDLAKDGVKQLKKFEENYELQKNKNQGDPMAQDGLHSADEDYLPVILDRSGYKRTLTKVFRARGAPLSDLELEMVWSGDFWLYLVFMLEYVAAEILELSGIVYNDLHALDGVASICRHHSLIGVVYDDELRNLFFSEEYKSPDDDKFPDFSRRESAIAFEMDSTQHFRSSSSYSASQSQMARFSVESAGGVVGEPSYSRDSLSLSASPTRCSAGADAPLRRSSRQSRLSGNLRGNPEEEKK